MNRSTHKKAKVFCIGFQKTGTTSMKHALRMLGYRVTGPNGSNHCKISQKLIPFTTRLSHRHEAFQDNPWPLVYKEMDALHPGSQFVLTLRDTDSWLRSVVNHFGERTIPMHEMIYGEGRGQPLGNEDNHRSVYERHNAAVLDYFHGRPDDLLIMNMAAGDGWDKLCPFLGLPVPPEAFPHANKASSRPARRSLPAETWITVKRAVKGRINQFR